MKLKLQNNFRHHKLSCWNFWESASIIAHIVIHMWIRSIKICETFSFYQWRSPAKVKNLGSGVAVMMANFFVNEHLKGSNRYSELWQHKRMKDQMHDSGFERSPTVQESAALITTPYGRQRRKLIFIFMNDIT